MPALPRWHASWFLVAPSQLEPHISLRRGRSGGQDCYSCWWSLCTAKRDTLIFGFLEPVWIFPVWIVVNFTTVQLSLYAISSPASITAGRSYMLFECCGQPYFPPLSCKLSPNHYKNFCDKTKSRLMTSMASPHSFLSRIVARETISPITKSRALTTMIAKWGRESSQSSEVIKT